MADYSYLKRKFGLESESKKNFIDIYHRDEKMMIEYLGAFIKQEIECAVTDFYKNKRRCFGGIKKRIFFREYIYSSIFHKINVLIDEEKSIDRCFDKGYWHFVFPHKKYADMLVETFNRQFENSGIKIHLSRQSSSSNLYDIIVTADLGAL